MSMDRGSAKHGPNQDDYLRSDVDDVVHGGHSSRAEEWREQEPSAEDQPEASRDPDEAMTGGAPPGMTPAETAERSEFARWIGGRHFPATSAELLAIAEQENAPDAMLAELRRLEPDREYESLAELWQTLGHGVERRRF